MDITVNSSTVSTIIVYLCSISKNYTKFTVIEMPIFDSKELL